MRHGQPLQRPLFPLLGLMIGLTLILGGCAAVPRDWRPPAEPQPVIRKPATGRVAAYQAYLRGRMDLLGGRNDQAIAQINKALEHDSGSIFLQTELISLLVQAGRMEEALKEAREAVAKAPKDLRSRLLLAGILANQGDPQGSEKAYRELLELDPDHPEALLFYGTLLIQENRLDEAGQALEKHTRVDPDSVMGHYYLSRVYSDQGRLHQALDSAKRVIELRPRFEAGHFELAKIFRRQGRTEEAARVYQRVLEHNPYSESAREELARLQIAKGDQEGAIKTLEEAPGQAGKGWIGLGLLYLKDKKADQAISVFKEVLDREPGNQTALYYYGAVQDEAKNPEEAIRALSRVGPGSEHYESARLRLAYAYEDQKRPAKAREAIREALKHRPDKPDLYLTLATLQEANKDYENGLATINQGLEHDANHVELIFRRGIILDKLKRRDEALVVMKKVLTLEEDHPYALNYVGYTWADQGTNLEKALSMIQQALSQRPKSGYITDSLAWVYYRLGRLDEALKVIRKAAEMVPDDPIITEHLAEILAKRGDLDEALEMYKRVLVLEPEEPERIKAIIKKMESGQ